MADIFSGWNLEYIVGIISRYLVYCPGLVMIDVIHIPQPPFTAIGAVTVFLIPIKQLRNRSFDISNAYKEPTQKEAL